MAGDGPRDVTPADDILRQLDTSVAHPARVYDALLGGKDNFAADRDAAEAFLGAFPGARQSVRANRAFLERLVRYLTAEAGIRQFLDIGTGLPSANNTHEVAQSVAPEARVVYVDNDPMVLLHAHALLTSAEPGGTAYIEADLRDPRKILQEAARLLDFSRPVAVMFIGVLHFILDEDHPYQSVETLMDAVPSGSYLAISHVSDDIYPEMSESVRVYNERAAAQEQSQVRNYAQCVRFFDGLELVEPGVVPLAKWRPRSEVEAAAQGAAWAGVARKP